MASEPHRLLSDSGKGARDVAESCAYFGPEIRDVMWKNANAVLFESFALPRARCEQRPLKVNDPTLSVEQLQRRAMSGRWQRRASVSLATESHFFVEKKGTLGHSGLSPVLGLSVTNCGCSFQESVRGELPDGSDSHDPPP
jgi:hypothetical protein